MKNTIVNSQSVAKNIKKPLQFTSLISLYTASEREKTSWRFFLINCNLNMLLLLLWGEDDERGKKENPWKYYYNLLFAFCILYMKSR